VSLRFPLSRHEVTFLEVVGVHDTVHEGLDDRRLLGRVDDRLVAGHERAGDGEHASSVGTLPGQRSVAPPW
jgi:xylan 1,4-beta-xylosidase